MFGKEKEKFYLSAVIILILSAVLIWQGILKGKAAIDDNINQIKDKNISLTAYSTRETTLERNLEKYNFATDKIKEINGYFLDENNLPDFIKQIEDSADQTSNLLEIRFADKADMTASDLVTAKKTSSVTNGASSSSAEDFYALRLDIVGSFENLERFVARMEGMPYHSYIDSMVINTGQSLNKTGSVDKNYSSVTLKTKIVLKAFKKQNFNVEK